MNFVDSVGVIVRAGDGGNGKLSFRHEKFIAKGGPDGGDGGHGGAVILVASRNQDTLARFRYSKELTADPGQPGSTSHKHGRNGKDLLVAVPIGTTAVTEDGSVIADMVQDGQQTVIARGGRGGFGNAHFVSSRRQAPNFAETGEPGENLELRFELKMIADVGLIGLPNAGKSTLLSRISNARPEIADYPFTTLKPNLGMVPIDDDTTVLVADIPGLIAGAASGKGLGHDFLKHIERTAAIIHLIDIYQSDVAATYASIRQELAAYQTDLSVRPEIIAITKIEGLDDDMIADSVKQLRRIVPKATPIIPISSQAGTGLRELLYKVKAIVAAARLEETRTTDGQPDLPVLTLPSAAPAWRVSLQNGMFIVTGNKIEKFAQRTDFNNDEAVQRLRTIMRKMGIMHSLERQGLEAGSTIRIGASDSFQY